MGRMGLLVCNDARDAAHVAHVEPAMPEPPLRVLPRALAIRAAGACEFASPVP